MFQPLAPGGPLQPPCVTVLHASARFGSSPGRDADARRMPAGRQQGAAAGGGRGGSCRFRDQFAFRSPTCGPSADRQRPWRGPRASLSSFCFWPPPRARRRPPCGTASRPASRTPGEGARFRRCRRRRRRRLQRLLPTPARPWAAGRRRATCSQTPPRECALPSWRARVFCSRTWQPAGAPRLCSTHNPSSCCAAQVHGVQGAGPHHFLHGPLLASGPRAGRVGAGRRPPSFIEYPPACASRRPPLQGRAG